MKDKTVFICQNCGNRFRIDQIELVKGGCNPIPITKDLKTETADTITISKDLLAQGVVGLQLRAEDAQSGGEVREVLGCGLRGGDLVVVELRHRRHHRVVFLAVHRDLAVQADRRAGDRDTAAVAFASAVGGEPPCDFHAATGAAADDEDGRIRFLYGAPCFFRQHIADRVLELETTDQQRAAYVKKEGFTFPVGHLNKEMQEAYGNVNVYPTLFLVNSRGVIVKNYVNYQPYETLAQDLEDMLKGERP
mgnify:CR=1 FL=1